VATSRDGGDGWSLKQVTAASNNPFNVRQGFGRSGCTVRTDSSGVVYVLANKFSVGSPGQGARELGLDRGAAAWMELYRRPPYNSDPI
jgi:hypothetical protein